MPFLVGAVVVVVLVCRYCLLCFISDAQQFIEMLVIITNTDAVDEMMGLMDERLL